MDGNTNLLRMSSFNEITTTFLIIVIFTFLVSQFCFLYETIFQHLPVQFERVGAVSMCGFLFKIAWQIDDGKSFKWTFLQDKKLGLLINDLQSFKFWCTV